jgi:tripartite-type tricarboxylate transporter receptor subunit TctC
LQFNIELNLTGIEEIKMTKRHLLKLAASLVVLGISSPSFAQTWPAKIITIVVPFPAGGTTDVLAREIATRLSTSLGQQVIVDNKPGAGATLGAGLVAKAAPDGYTLLMGAIHHTVAANVYKKLPYDFQKDFSPITTVAMVPNILVVKAPAKYKNVKDLAAAVKGDSGKLSYGSNGNGTAQHMIGTQFQALAGGEMLHIPYKGSAPLTTDLLGGQVDMSFDTITPVLPFIKEGKLVPLAVTTGKRSSTLPNVPTMKEAGLPGLDIGTWFGLLAPTGTPKEITTRLNAEVVKITKSADFKKKMFDIGAEPIGNKPEEMAKQIKEETEKFSHLVKVGKVTVE